TRGLLDARLRRRPAAPAGAGVQAQDERRGRRARPLYLLRHRIPPRHGDRAVGSVGPEGPHVPADSRGVRGLGRQRSGAAVSQPGAGMSGERILASYLIETPLDPTAVAEVMAGEQSCGTFTRVAGETDALRARARATVESVQLLDEAAQPGLPNALLQRRRQAGPWRRARVEIAFPPANIGANLPTLASTVAGNLYDLGEVTGLRLETLRVPA